MTVQKGDFVKIGMDENNKCVPFNNPRCVKIRTSRVIGVHHFVKKRNGPAFTCRVDGAIQTIALGRKDCYQLITDKAEYVLLRMEE